MFRREKPFADEEQSGKLWGHLARNKHSGIWVWLEFNLKWLLLFSPDEVRASGTAPVKTFHSCVLIC